MEKMKIKDNTEPQIGYVYFIMNNHENRVYVGETTNLSRIEKYEKIKNTKKVQARHTINRRLLEDMQADEDDSDEDRFSIYYFETTNYKKYEKIYISYLHKNSYAIYNDVLYKVKYDDNEVDFSIIQHMGLEPNPIIQMWKDLNSDKDIPYQEFVYLGDDMYGDRYGYIVGGF